MKIVIFEPHPDDLLFGVGPFIFDLIDEGHDIHVITITDGRACYRTSEDFHMDERDVAKMRLNEARQTIQFLGLPESNLHLLKFYDAEGQKYVKEGMEKVVPLIKDADLIILPSNNNAHVDHQATHDIAIGAAQRLNLNIDYWVYFIPAYGRFNEDSKDHQVEVQITDEVREKMKNWLQIYQSQKNTPLSWKMYSRFVKRLRSVIIGKFKLKDKGKYHNF